MLKYYAGIGSQTISREHSQAISYCAKFMAEHGFSLRSGGANGADLAFEYSTPANSPMQIMLPWPGFNGAEGRLAIEDQLVLTDLQYVIAREHLFAIGMTWHDSLKQGARKLHARNVMQILGPDFNSPCKLVITCSPNRTLGKGGTAIGMALAKQFGIQEIALWAMPSKRQLVATLQEFVDSISAN